MNLTKEEAIRLHRELWGWLAENPEAEKEDWPGWKKDYGFDIGEQDYCFCCAYVEQKNVVSPCRYCPLKWGKDGVYCSVYVVPWERTHRLAERSRLASLIRDLPVKEDVHATK